MATVFAAEDLKHHRPVAIKVLHPELAAYVGAERFLHEIQTTAMLHHPNIMPLFDSGAADGLLFYVMPVVDGESLRQRIIRDKQLPIDDALRIAAEVSTALDYAHRHGVVHRDIKPENILLHDGRAVVADFGIALEVESTEVRLTQTGMSLGTPAYMSPEQALGERTLDARTDVYAIGAVLHEMLVGAPPFTGATAQAIVARVISERPGTPSRQRREIPSHVDHAILTALEKDPASRFETAAAFAGAIGMSYASGPNRRARRSTAMLRRAALGAAAAVAAGIAWLTLRPVTPERSALAVLCFTSGGGDSLADLYLSSGITGEVYDGLTALPGLVVRGSGSSAHFTDPRQDLRVVADSLKAGMLVILRVGHVGGALQVAAELLDARNNTALWHATYARNMTTDLNAINDSISGHIIDGLRLRLTAAQRAASRTGRTQNAQAHDLLVLARGLIANRGRTGHELDSAIALMTHAIELDSSYAQAWAGRAAAEGLRPAFWQSRDARADFEQAAFDVARALRLDSTSAEAHTTLGFIDVFHTRDYPAAHREFLRAIARDPNQSSAWLFQAWYYAAADQLDSAAWSIRQAQKIDPLNAVAAIRLGTVLYMGSHDTAAVAEYRRILGREPDNSTARAEMMMALASAHQCGAAMAEWDRAVAGPLVAPYAIGAAAGLCGRPQDATRYADKMASEPVADGFWIATIYAAMGDQAHVRYWLERASADNSWGLFFLRVDQAFAAYRNEAWFQRIERQVHLLPGA
jgi:serine/threonine-protein kinase